jgi:hypothetical protein
MSRVTVDDLPDPDDSRAVFAFAMSFSGYEYFGSFSASMKAAKQRTRATLLDVRNELFASARASRHAGTEDFLDLYRELLPLLHDNRAGCISLLSAEVVVRPQSFRSKPN